MSAVLKILSDLKKKKISTSTIEKELKFSNGLLGKAAKGKTQLSANKLDLLQIFYRSHMGLDHFVENINSAPISEIPATDVVKEMVDVIRETKEDVSLYVKTIYAPAPWVKLIEDYCQEKGLIPEDLIDLHKKGGFLGDFKVGEKTSGGGVITKVVADWKPAFDVYLDEIYQAKNPSECEGISKAAKNDVELSYKQKEAVKLKCVERSREFDF